MPLPESFRTARVEAERLAPHHLADLIESHRDPNVMAALAWRDLGAPSLVGVTTPSNRASQPVLLKVGLHYEREIVMEGTRCFLYRTDCPLSEATGQ